MKNSIKVISLLFLYLLQWSEVTSASPLTSVKCSLADSVCLTNQARGALHKFVVGLPKYGIEKLDKVLLDPVKLNSEVLSFELTDLRVGGLANAIIDIVSVNMDLKIMRLLFRTTPSIKYNYKVDGVLFSIPIYGEGKSNATLKNLEMEVLLAFDIEKNEQGKDIMDIKSHFYGFNVLDGTEYYFDNMYNGDQKKSDLFHFLVREYWRTALSSYGRFFADKLNDKIFVAVQSFMRLSPLEEIALYP